MTRRLSICFICSEYPEGPHGGIGTMTQELARALVEQGHRVQVAGVYPPDYPAPDEEDDQGVQVLRLREKRYPSGWMVSRHELYRRVSGWARRKEIDLIEVPDFQGWAAGWLPLGVPVVARLHGSETYFASEMGWPRNKLSFWIERACLRRADYWSSVCRYTAERTQTIFGLKTEPSAILYNPVRVSVESRRKTAVSRKVVFSGTITGKKGVVGLIKAWPRVVGQFCDAELHLFGRDGRDGGSMMTEVLKSSIPGRIAGSVQFHGHVKRELLHGAYSEAAVAVFPSHAEAFAIAPLEAMACGCPTIYSKRGSGPELITAGKNGLLIEPDDPADIANSIVRLLADPRFAKELGDQGRKRIQESFSLPKLLAQNVEFYEECIGRFQHAWLN
jgi:glycosyltransferase involved in cell wall biosynthesis